MGQLIVLGYPTPLKPKRCAASWWACSKTISLLEDAVVVVHHSEGKVELRQALNLTAAGAVSGGFGAPWWACCFSIPWWVRRWVLVWVLHRAP